MNLFVAPVVVSVAIRLISPVIASSAGGRPDLFVWVHFAAIRRRCQRGIVPGVTGGVAAAGRTAASTMKLAASAASGLKRVSDYSELRWKPPCADHSSRPAKSGQPTTAGSWSD